MERKETFTSHFMPFCSSNFQTLNKSYFTIIFHCHQRLSWWGGYGPFLVFISAYLWFEKKKSSIFSTFSKSKQLPRFSFISYSLGCLKESRAQSPRFCPLLPEGLPTSAYIPYLLLKPPGGGASGPRTSTSQREPINTSTLSVLNEDLQASCQRPSGRRACREVPHSTPTSTAKKGPAA